MLVSGRVLKCILKNQRAQSWWSVRKTSFHPPRLVLWSMTASAHAANVDRFIDKMCGVKEPVGKISNALSVKQVYPFIPCHQVLVSSIWNSYIYIYIYYLLIQHTYTHSCLHSLKRFHNPYLENRVVVHLMILMVWKLWAFRIGSWARVLKGTCRPFCVPSVLNKPKQNRKVDILNSKFGEKKVLWLGHFGPWNKSLNGLNFNFPTKYPSLQKFQG